MLWVKAFHVIFMVCWFAGIFYLPRLFVYHAESTDATSNERFKVMERKLFYGITTPSAILTIIFGVWVMSFAWSSYLGSAWLHAKLGLVTLLVVYHIYCGYLVKVFKEDRNTHSHKFYRWLNEFPVFILVGAVILAVVKPF